MPAKRMDDGRLIAQALVTKPGVFKYLDPKYPGGWRLELRPDSEVYSRATMDSMIGNPVTAGHPKELLNTTTARAHMVGSSGTTVERVPVQGDVDWLRTTLIVSDANTIKRMDNGEDAVSWGYKCELIERAGVDPKYGPYHCIQTNIRGNHIAAAIPLGRAGGIARARMDDYGTYSGDDSMYGSPVDVAPDPMLVLTDVVDGHQHSIDLLCPTDGTSSAKADDAEYSHCHEVIRGLDGSLTIAENAGHGHTIDLSSLGVRTDRADRADKKTAPQVAPQQVGGRRPTGSVPAAMKPEPAKKTLGGKMEPEKMLETVRTLEAGLKKAEQEKSTETARADAAEGARDMAVGRAQQLEKELEAARASIAAGTTAVETEAVTRERQRADAAEAKVARFDEAFEREVRARTKVMHEAALAIGPEFRMDDLSSAAIRRAVVQRLDAEADVGQHVPDGVIAGQYEQLLKRKLSRAREDARVSDILITQANQGRTDSAPSKKEKMEAYRNQAKKPLSELLGRKDR